jgi:fibro-slime domain-containing protein
MSKHLTTTIASYCLLGLAGIVSISLPRELVSHVQAFAPAPGDTIRVLGVVRDFQKDNVNFNVMPSGGSGHYAGNIAQGLTSAEQPSFVGNGFKVGTQWKDKNANPIAPHLYRVTYPAAVAVKDAPTLTNSPVLNTYYSDAGPYGGTNIDDAPQWITNSPMPALSAPTGMPALAADYLKSGGGTSVLSGNLHVNKFDISNGHRVLVNGDVVLLVNDLFKLNNVNTRIELSAGATFTLYFKKDATVQDRARLHLDTASPERVRIYNLGINDFIVQNQGAVVGLITSPAGNVQLQDSAHFYGRATALSFTVQNTSGVHIDVGSPADACNVAFADVLGTQSVASSGGIPSSAAYDLWFRDSMGTNLSTIHPIDLTESGSGVFEYHNDSFLPIDDQLYGNEGQAHNYYFTYAIDTRFTYESCGGQFFEFEGADDAWMFVNGDLAIDLGGIVPATKQWVDMDRLGLTDGQTYTLHFFYAQRNSTSARFHLRTNLELQGENVAYAVSAGAD